MPVSNKTAPNRTCAFCGRPFYAKPNKIRAGLGRFCSLSCAKRSRAPKPIEQRFWSYVVKHPDGCWEWRGGVGSHGYGLLGVGSRLDNSRDHILTHRYSYELHFGPLPSDKIVCHRCDNRLCVRPDHLYAGSYSDNLRDAYARTRSGRVCLRGESNASAKLNGEQVLEIRQRAAAGESARGMARKLGLSKTMISAIVGGRSWAHIPTSLAAKQG